MNIKSNAGLPSVGIFYEHFAIPIMMRVTLRRIMLLAFPCRMERLPLVPRGGFLSIRREGCVLAQGESRNGLPNYGTNTRRKPT